MPVPTIDTPSMREVTSSALPAIGIDGMQERCPMPSGKIGLRKAFNI
jgi:hypothetical protein